MNNDAAPLTPEVVDALLSAELDGEFDAAARDHGYAPVIARERLDALPNVAERRAALERARDAMNVSALEESVRSRLLDGARGATTDDLAARRARRSWTHVARITGAVAAGLLLVIGVGASIASLGSGESDDDAASSGDVLTEAQRDAAAETDESATTTAEGSAGADSQAGGAVAPVLYDFGTVTDEQQLRAAVEQAVSTLLQQASGDASTLAAPRAANTCVESKASEFSVGPAPVVRGPVVYAGEAAEVLVFASDGDYLALTVADPSGSCALLLSQFLHPGN